MFAWRTVLLLRGACRGFNANVLYFVFFLASAGALLAQIFSRALRARRYTRHLHLSPAASSFGSQGRHLRPPGNGRTRRQPPVTTTRLRLQNWRVGASRFALLHTTNLAGRLQDAHCCLAALAACLLLHFHRAGWWRIVGAAGGPLDWAHIRSPFCSDGFLPVGVF